MLTITPKPQLIFFWTLVATFALKMFLAVWFPLTGDEAFFYQWGQAPALGYADHPPMVGWWLAILAFISDQMWAARLAPVFLTLFVAVGIVDVLRRHLPLAHQSNAWWMGAIYLVMPWSWMWFLVTTDTPLIFFMSLSAWLFVRADTTQRLTTAWPWYAAAGIALGFAFLSKYFAVLLGAAFSIYILGWRRDRWWALLLLVIFSLPSVGLHVYFNAHHGWQNVMFNLFNRHQTSGGGIQTVVVYVSMMVYLLTPWLLYRSIKSAASGARQIKILTLVLLIVPLLLLLLVAFKRSVGLHWVMGFVPVFMVWAGLSAYHANQLPRLFLWTVGLSVPHLAGILFLVASPLQWWDSSKQFEKLVFLRHASQVTQQLSAHLPGTTILMTTAYSPSAVLAYHHGQYVPVFGVGRHYARQDDLVVNFAHLNGQNIRVFKRSPFDVASFQPFFNQVDVTEFTVEGATFYWLDGTGFQFETYKQDVLSEIAIQFHDIPSWLPVLANPFCEQYGFTQCSPSKQDQSSVQK